MNIHKIQEDHQELLTLYKDGIKLKNKWKLSISWKLSTQLASIAEKDFVLETWKNELATYQELHMTLYDSLESISISNAYYLVFDTIGNIYEVQEVLVNSKKRKFTVVLTNL
ncbi:hypothetical protein GCM10022393_26360 [Aquimarina addita]|uniref:Uncharacterized protein n=1 Tax=Aquimarina addita TaxID=870485 RepID=A0ABP6UNW0_9FLAO